MSNRQALKTEHSIDRIIARMNRAREQGYYHKMQQYKTVMCALIAKWERIKGDTVDNNAIMQDTILNKMNNTTNQS